MSSKSSQKSIDFKTIDCEINEVIPKNKQQLFKRFIREVSFVNESDCILENINKAFCSLDKDLKIADDNLFETISLKSIEEDFDKNYEDIETLSERIAQWDVFKRTPRADLTDSSKVDLQKILKFLKVLFYPFLFLSLLVFVFLNKGTLFIAASNVLPQKTDNLVCHQVDNGSTEHRCIKLPKGRNRSWVSSGNLSCLDYEEKHFETKTCLIVNNYWAWCMFLMIVSSYFFVFLRSLTNIMFKKKTPLYRKALLLTMIFETLHSIGLCILVFVVLPDLDNIMQMCFLLLGLSIIPSFVKLVFRNQSEKNKLLIIGVDFLAFIIQLTASFLSPFIASLYPKKKTLLYLTPISTILTSLKWWENYANDLHSHCLEKLLKQLHASRRRLQIIANLWKILLTFVLMPLCLSIQTPYISSLECNSTISPIQIPSLRNDWIWVLLVHIGSSFMAYIAARSSAKILFQKVCYALPLAISSFVIFIVSIIGCEHFNKNPCTFGKQNLIFYKCYKSGALEEVWLNQFWFLVPLLWLSQCWTAWHIWYPTNAKLADSDKLFVYPLYDGVVLEQSLLHNRQRKEPKIYKQRITQSQKTEKAPTAYNDFISKKMEEKDKIPFIYICSTMWHETRSEMVSLLKSLFKIDLDHFARKRAKSSFRYIDHNYYEFEAHIFFDDAFTRTDHKNHFNSYVRTFLSVVQEAASCVHNVEVLLDFPSKFKTPYGGKIFYKMPGGNNLIVHLKDKTKIRHKKRWSQVMYMYYFLSHNLWLSKISWKRKEERAENIFLMALDGDVDFEPQAMVMLLDLLRRNEEVGAACGRIHPTGSGPIVWYQKFEYALGHWMQKATEHVFGCALCAPGCFSMFRGKALMAENVMATYTTQSTEPIHYIQYDQGEDRWLCTLLLQQGYRVEYCAASDAFTSAPESLYEFFKQRRRWMMSTMANILDLLLSWKYTTNKNDTISTPFLIYQTLLFVVSIVGPGTILLMIIGAVNVVFDSRLGIMWSTFLNVVPVAIYIAVCYKCSDDYQLFAASILTGLYCLVQMLVLVGFTIQMASNPITIPSTLFFFFITGTFILAAFLHPQEFLCLFHGFTYYLCIPTMYLLLSIYTFVNLHVISWGTREDPSSKAQNSENPFVNRNENIAKNKYLAFLPKKMRKKGELDFNCGNCFQISCCLKEKDKSEFQMIEMRLKDIQMNIEKMKFADSMNEYQKNQSLKNSKTGLVTVQTIQNNISNFEIKDQQTNKPIPLSTNKPTTSNLIMQENKYKTSEVSSDADWLFTEEGLREAQEGFLGKAEYAYFEDLISKYLYPLKKDEKSQEDITRKLRDLRNKTSSSFLVINTIFIVVVLSLQMNVEYLSVPFLGGIKIEPIGFAFMCVYGLVILTQIIGMIWHRAGTFLHLMTSTSLEFKHKDERENEKTLLLSRKMSKMVPQKDTFSTSCTSELEDDSEFKHKNIMSELRKGSRVRNATLRLDDVFDNNLQHLRSTKADSIHSKLTSYQDL